MGCAFWILVAVSFICWILKHTTLTVNVYPNQNAEESKAELSDNAARAALACCKNRDLN